MRSSRILIVEEKINVNQYVRELINNTGIISYPGAAREAENFTYKRHNFSVILSATTKGEPESPETMYLYNRAASLMTQMVTFGIKIGMEFIPGGCKSIPLLWITDKTSYEIQEEQRQALFQARFIRYIDVLNKKSLNILPHEISRILEKIAKTYPYTLATYTLAPGDFIPVQIYPTLKELMSITIGDIDPPEKYSIKEIFQQRALYIEDISLQLGEKGEEWYTLHYSSKLIIQALEVMGTGTVERIKEGHTPLKILLPCSLPEIAALGMTEPNILRAAKKIAPALLMDPKTGSVLMDCQASSLTDRSNIDSTYSTEAKEQSKAEDN